MTKRTPIIAGNWKMYKKSAEAEEMVNALIPLVKDNNYAELAVCPPFTALSAVASLISETNIELGAQNCYFEEEGAFTGEVSTAMLKDLSCKYVIVGHSERRQYFGETDENINKKILALYGADLIPIVCVGELLEQRKSEKTFDVVSKQIKICLRDLPTDKMKETVIAYEPVWAIGTGLTATPLQAQEVHKMLREPLMELFGEDVSKTVRIQYGGSVKPENVKDIMAEEDIDGALVGGASLQAETFSKIVNFKEN